MVDIAFKIILVGPAAVGKTSLLNRFIHNQFATSYKMTIGVDFLKKDIKINDANIKLIIWDIGGQERFKFMRKNFYSGANGALLVFDLTRDFTYSQLTGRWYPELTKFIREDIPFILIGNKLDLLEDVGTVVDRNEAKSFAESRRCNYIETSAKSGENVEDAFMELAKKITMSKSITI